MKTFNTKRDYSPAGQIIHMAQSGRVVGFMDVTRNITGFMVVNSTFTEADLMAAYDAGTYEPSVHSIDANERNRARDVRDCLLELDSDMNNAMMQ